MNIRSHIWADPATYLVSNQPDKPVHFFCPSALHAKAKVFQDGFPGLVTFAVKSNPDPMVITNLVRAGLTGFDVASPNEIRLIRQLAPTATMHYNNPVKSRSEITFAVGQCVRSFAVDSVNELAKLTDLVPKGAEMSVRFKLPVKGAVYDFGTKFGAEPRKAADLLRAVQAAGYLPSLTFHPGTQCEDPGAWAAYISEAAAIARAADLPLHRLNVGGGFPCRVGTARPELSAFFDTISSTVGEAFGNHPPALVCEPGRGMVAEAFAHAVRIKGIGDSGALYLNDGIYGGLSEFPVLPVVRSFDVIGPDGAKRTGETQPRTLFGPTCDSLDTLPNPLDIPGDTQEGDYILFPSMGAYVRGVTTDFNGYGQIETATVLHLS